MNAGISWLMTLALLGVLATNASSRQDDSKEQSTESVWGGDHVAMEITKSGAQIEFDCASGSILEPVPLDSKTGFKLKGTFTREHGGPIRRDEAPNTANATYSGRIEAGKMTLTVMVDGKNPYDSPLVLQRGQAGRVMKCR